MSSRIGRYSKIESGRFDDAPSHSKLAQSLMAEANAERDTSLRRYHLGMSTNSILYEVRSSMASSDKSLP